MFHHTPFRLITLAVVLGGLLIATLTAGYFGLEILTEIMVLAMLVLALDLVAALRDLDHGRCRLGHWRCLFGQPRHLFHHGHLGLWANGLFFCV